MIKVHFSTGEIIQVSMSDWSWKSLSRYIKHCLQKDFKNYDESYMTAIVFNCKQDGTHISEITRFDARRRVNPLLP